MQKVLGQDIKDLDERKQFLLDNADEVVEMDYSKAFDADELAKKKTELAEKSIKINDLNEAIKDYKEKVNLELKPLRKRSRNFLATSRQRAVSLPRSVTRLWTRTSAWLASTTPRACLCQVALRRKKNYPQQSLRRYARRSNNYLIKINYAERKNANQS